MEEANRAIADAFVFVPKWGHSETAPWSPGAPTAPCPLPSLEKRVMKVCQHARASDAECQPMLVAHLAECFRTFLATASLSAFVLVTYQTRRYHVQHGNLLSLRTSRFLQVLAPRALFRVALRAGFENVHSGCQAFERETNHANANHGLAMIQSYFIITAKPSRLEEPTEGPFHDPPLRKNLEALGLVASSHDLQPQFAEGAELLDPLHQGSEVAAIGPNDLHSLIHRCQKGDETLAAHQKAAYYEELRLQGGHGECTSTTQRCPIPRAFC